MKVVLRGVCMASSAGICQTLEGNLTCQEAALEKLEAALSTNSKASMDWDRQCHKVCKIWDSLEEHNCHTGRRRWYMEGDKADCLLAHLILSESTQTPIFAFRNAQGRIVPSQHAINDVFEAHIRALYAVLHDQSELHNLSDYLGHLMVPSLSSEYRDLLGTPLSQQELLE
ncbi:hypothetical protein NDU88_005427 [Pleurodeles waltl]|uniref:Uncharacterized protein n=1 Tax=Pleurodeles waltl TaxID=8319 RepID=A0AAV7N4B7_PLEWA|nr:hypothetical protein NDU88_005427 [Pleurodeles waltl]